MVMNKARRGFPPSVFFILGANAMPLKGIARKNKTIIDICYHL